jgi:hypothetical protein
MKISLGNPDHHDEEWEVSHSNFELKKDIKTSIALLLI